MKVGDFVTLRYYRNPDAPVGRIIWTFARHHNVKWSQNYVTSGAHSDNLLAVNMSDEQKMLWILENE